MTCSAPTKRACVRGERDHRARAGGDPVDRRDHGQRALAQGLDERAGHACELEQSRRRERDELADDLLDVTPGAEPAPLPGDHEHLHIAPMGQADDEVTQLRVQLEGERVELVGTVESHRRDPALDLEIELLDHQARPYST